VGDSYQPLEEKYRLCRQALEVIAEFGYPVQVLTKSTLVRRDLDLLQQINNQSRALVCFSISSVDERISRAYEPGVPSPKERLETLKFFKDRGIPCGLFLLPVIPYVTDTTDLLDQAVRKAKEVKVDYLIFGGMTLKQGRQTSYFLNELSKHRPELLSRYRATYRGDRWGQATGEYYRELNKRFWAIAAAAGIPLRMPPNLYRDLLDERDRIVVMLDQMDYLLRLRGKRSSYGYAAHTVSRRQGPVSDLSTDNLLPGDQIRGISAKAGAVIAEIISTGTAKEYERLLYSTGVS
jgi:DNA repair photolyase